MNTNSIAISSTSKRRPVQLVVAALSTLLIVQLVSSLACHTAELTGDKNGQLAATLHQRRALDDFKQPNIDDHLVDEDDANLDDDEQSDEWLPLNESLQLLLDDRIVNDNELVVAATAPAKRPTSENEPQIKSTTTIREPETTTTTTTTTRPHGASRKRVQRLLVRQLTSLIMNNEPEQIAENLGESTRVRGQIMSEIDNNNQQLGSSIGHQQVGWTQQDSEIHRRESMTDEARLPQSNENRSHDNPEPEGGELDEAANQQGPGGLQEEQTISCPPDYEDTEAMAALAANGGNLTAEQRAQLQADSSSLLNNSTDYHHQLVAQCASQGLQRIEFIVKVITPILFSIIIVVGLLGNIIVMLVILEDRKTERELTPTNLLILDLSLADLSFIIFCIPFTAWDYAVSHWVFGPLWCKFNQYLIVVCALSSIYTLVLMSVDRFMAIVYPIECISYRTSKNMLHAIYIKWVIILLIALPTWKMHGLIDSSFGPDYHDCRLLADQYNPLHFQIIFFITSYLFPLILIFCLYFGLLNKLWFGSKPQGHKESTKMLESKKKVTWLVAGIVIVFALCWCPIQVMLILMRLKAYKITPTYVAIQVFSHTLGYMNSCVNPIVYAFASETFLQSFKRSWLGRAFNWLFCTDCCTSGSSSSSSAPTLNHHSGPNTHNGHSTLAAMHSHTADGHNLHGNTRFMSARLSEQHQMMSSLTVEQNDKTRNQSLNHIFSSSASTPTGKGVHNQSNHNQDDSSNRRNSLENDGSCRTSTLVMNSPHHSRSDSNSACRQQPLPLEPRDRPSLVGLKGGQARPTNGATKIEMCHSHELNRSRDELNHSMTTTSSSLCRSQTPTASSNGQTLIPRQPTAAGFSFGAATFGSSSGSLSNSNNRIAKQQLVAQMVNQSSTNSNQQVAHRCEPMEQP